MGRTGKRSAACGPLAYRRFYPIHLFAPTDPRVSELGFGSPHSSVMNAVFGDGSVHALSMNIDTTVNDSASPAVYGVFYRLGVRDDGMHVDANQY